MSHREKLLRSLSAAQFALWELHLYLDTHANDMEALSLHEKYEVRYARLKQEYEASYGPLMPTKGEGLRWLNDPWPWDVQGGDD